MSTQVQYRRGTSAQNDAFVGALAEITVDTTNSTLRVHNGVTAGGSALISANATQTLSNKTYNGTSLSVTGNVTAAGATINGDLTVTGNATLSGNIVGDRLVNGTTNIEIATANGNANISVGGTSNVAVFSTAGLDLTGSISATGNITGNFILGNGSQLTGIDATSIQSGTSNVRVVSSGGNVAAGIGGTSNVMVIATTGVFVTGVASASGNIQGGNLLTDGLISATSTITAAANISGGNILTGGLISATGNITGGNVLGGANVNATTHTGTTVSVTGNIDGGNLRTAGVITATGNIQGGNLLTAGLLSVNSGNASGAVIVNAGGNGVGNIGSATATFNILHARATSAQYADVAEKYVADRFYSPGTVLEIGGAAEVQETTAYASTRVVGVVSTNPALIMNSGQGDANTVQVALLGRVPCRVTGVVQRGDLMTSSDRPGVATALVPGDYMPGCVIGKALEGHSGDREGTIEILVGRL